jgi:hypothetical protein
VRISLLLQLQWHRAGAFAAALDWQCAGAFAAALEWAQ